MSDPSQATQDAVRWQRLMDLFDEVSDLPAAARNARVERLRDGDPQLAQQLAAMLASDAVDSGVLDRSLDALAPDIAPLRAGGGCSGEVLGRYRLVDVIGSGGMGEVWLAERADGEYQQRVALKLLKRGMDTDAILRRFQQERSILARLSHPNVVRLLDGGASGDGRPYYVMEHVDGTSVTGYAAHHALAVRDRVALVAVIADAVAHAHAKLIVHRDLKPSNVLIDAAGMPHLLDFGIAKLLEESAEQTMTRTGVRLLSPAYASPEQIRGDDVGTATDIYALGVLLFELLAGTLPHQRRSRDLDMLASGLHDETGMRPSEAIVGGGDFISTYGRHADRQLVGRELAGDLDVIVAKAMQAEPDRRYRTVAAFADDLRRWLDGRTIAARPDSARYRFGKFIRRNRLAVVAAGLVLTSLVAGLGAALWQAGIAREQARRAEQQVQRTEQVKAFLIDMFRQNDPSRSHGESLTGEQMLERSQATLQQRFANDPETQGELLVAIAEIRHALTDFKPALGDAERGIALLESSAGSADARLAYALLVRARIHSNLDSPAEAEADLRRVRAIYAGDPAGNAERIDAVDQELAGALRFTASGEAALALQRQVVTRSVARLGERSELVAERRAALALMLEEAGEYAESESVYRVAIPILEAARTRPDPYLARSHATFAGLLDRVGKRDESAHYFDRALAAQATLFGTESRDYTRTLFSRGILLLSQQHFDRAEADFRQTLAVSGGKGSPGGHSMRYLGRALLGQGRLAEAAQCFARAEAIYRETNLPRDIQRWRARADYGEARLRMGDAVAAREAVVAAITGMRELLDEDDIHLVPPLLTLGQIDRERGDPVAALAHHDRAWAIAEAKVGAQSINALAALNQQVLDLLARNQDGDIELARERAAKLVELARAAESPALDDYLATAALAAARSASTSVL